MNLDENCYEIRDKNSESDDGSIQITDEEVFNCAQILETYFSSIGDSEKHSLAGSIKNSIYNFIMHKKSQTRCLMERFPSLITPRYSIELFTFNFKSQNDKLEDLNVPNMTASDFTR